MVITKVSIQNPVFATMMMVALMVLGLFAYQRLPVEQMPDVSPPGAYIETRYPGASPEAVMQEVTRPIEEAVNGIAGVKRIMSNSWEGQSGVNVEFNLNTDMNRAVQEIRDRVAGVAGGFNRDVKAPTVWRWNNDNSSPITVLNLKSADRGIRELSMIADQTVVKRLQRVGGVARVDAWGLASRQVVVQLDPVRLKSYGITPAQVSDALRAANADFPVGLLTNATGEAIVRVEGKTRDPKALADIPIMRNTSMTLTLGDLGRVVETEREQMSMSRIDGKPAVTVNIFKMQDANIVETGEGVKEAVAELKKALPPGIELEVLYANSDWVKDSLNGVKRTILEGALLTVAIVFLFLKSWRSTIITGLTLPVSVMASFIAVYACGFSLNFMTMMALSLCIGLLIDDAIVVRENIVRHVHMGKDHHTASLEGTQEIGLAVMATTFAICAVFVPIAFMSGIIGKFFFPFGITVAVAVLVSLFVSFTLDPMLSAVWKDPPSNRVESMPVIGHLLRATDRGMDALHRWYGGLIEWIFSRKRFVPHIPFWLPKRGYQRVLGIPVWARPVVDGVKDATQPRRLRLATITPRGVILWIGAMSLVGAFMLAPVVGTEFIPQTDQGFTNINIRMPVGTSLERANEKVAQLEEIVRQVPEIKSMSTYVGTDTGRNSANINIKLTDRKDRKRTQNEVEADIRKRLSVIPGTELSVGWNRPIYVGVLGPDQAVIDQLTVALSERIKKIPGITDLETSVKPGIPAYAVRVKPDAAKELNLTPSQLASSLRAFVQGDVATYWTTSSGENVEVQLRLSKDSRENISQLSELPIMYAKDGTAITLSRVADVVPVKNPEVIKRQDLQLRQGIYAGVEGRPGGDVGRDVQKVVDAFELPPGYRYDVGGQTREQNEAFMGMLQALGLAVIFIYIVLASQFGSFIQPIAIMASLPLSLIGVMIALLVTGSTLNVFSMIGLVMLMGLVTKNAILLVDFANHARKAGAQMKEALLMAGQTRMRPIMMTTFAMVFGMLPLAMALNEGGEIQSSMGRAIIGGVITSTLLTLVVVPVIYSYLVRDRKPAAAPADETVAAAEPAAAE
jgi:multidrug efflux pump subunit AcrB